MTDRDLAIGAALAGASVDRVEKGAGDFATTADLEAERAILEILRAARPDDLVVGEESGRNGEGGSGLRRPLRRRGVLDRRRRRVGAARWGVLGRRSG